MVTPLGDKVHQVFLLQIEQIGFKDFLLRQQPVLLKLVIYQFPLYLLLANHHQRMVIVLVDIREIESLKNFLFSRKL